MNSMRLAVLVLGMVLAVSSTQIVAADGFKIGLGAVECAKMRSMALTGDSVNRDAMRQIYLSWVHGFLVGMNMAMSGLQPEKDYREMGDAEVMWGQILAYCRKNPQKLVVDGAIDIWQGLPARAKR